jgi:Uma2 family endonuclease
VTRTAGAILLAVRATLRASPSPERLDQRVRLHDVPWADYERLVEMRGESSGTRLTYLDGELELMTPSIDHESLKTMLARLLEAWSEHEGVELEGAGSWTIKEEAKKGGVEPDECYLIGAHKRRTAKVPDFACEVVWTSGGIAKLEVYRVLGVPEVWFYERGKLSFHVLDRSRYLRATRSRLLPRLDPALIESCMRAESQVEALRRLRGSLTRAKKRSRR